MKCKNQELLKKISIEKIDQNMEVTFEVLDDLPDCKKISADRYVSIDGTPSFNRYKRPVNRFECDSLGCLSGTLSVTAGGSVTYRAQYDATEFSAGVIALYTIPGDPSTVLKVSIASDANFANADVYNITVPKALAGADGFAPVVIDLSQTPSSTDGNGWTPSANGAYIKVESESAFSISSISIIDTMEDFEINDVVKIACLSGLEGTEDIDAAEATCLSGGYNTSSAPTFTRTVTGGMVTPNYRKLNPFVGKGEKTTGFLNETIEKTVVLSQDGNYGVVTLADMADECGWVYVAIADSCNVTDAKLERLSIPTLVNVDEKHYLVIRDANGVTTLYFNKELAGTEVRIAYPKEVALKSEYVADMENVGTKRVRMSYPIKQSDGVTVMRVYGNVLITSFPATINTEDTSFAFTISIQMDSDGHYYREWVIE